jgi:centractin
LTRINVQLIVFKYNRKARVSRKELFEFLGFAMPHSILRNDVAGRDVTRYLKLLLRKEGYAFKTTAEFEIVKSIKERACFLSPTAQKDETGQGDKSQFTLPDGTSIEV